MPKTSATESPQRSQGLKESIGTKTVDGLPKLKLVAKSDISDSTPPFSPPKSLESKSQRSSTEPSVEFQWQRFSQIAHELPPLFLEHWRELKPGAALNVDFDQYYVLDVQGVLRILTVRVEGQLAGYIFATFAAPPNHKHELWAQASMYWLDPVARQGWTGVKLFKTLIRDAKVMGAANLIVVSVIGFSDNRVTKLLQRLGLQPTATMHSMRL